MSVDGYSDLVEFLQGELGENLYAVVAYDEESHCPLFESAFSDRFLEDMASVTPDELHQHLVIDSMQVDMTDEQYGVTTYGEIAVSEEAVTCHLVADDREGVLVVMARAASITVPGFVDACRERLPG